VSSKAACPWRSLIHSSDVDIDLFEPSRNRHSFFRAPFFKRKNFLGCQEFFGLKKLARTLSQPPFTVTTSLYRLSHGFVPSPHSKALCTLLLSPYDPLLLASRFFNGYDTTLATYFTSFCRFHTVFELGVPSFVLVVFVLTTSLVLILHVLANRVVRLGSTHFVVIYPHHIHPHIVLSSLRRSIVRRILSFSSASSSITGFPPVRWFFPGSSSLPSHRLSLPSRCHDIPPTTLLLFKPYLTSSRHLFRGRLNCKILKTLRRTRSFCHHRLLDARRTVVPHPSPQFSPLPPCSFAFLARYSLHMVHCWFHPSSPVSSQFAAFMQFFAGFHPGSPPFPSGFLPFSYGSLLVSSQFAGFILVPAVCAALVATFIYENPGLA